MEVAHKEVSLITSLSQGQGQRSPVPSPLPHLSVLGSNIHQAGARVRSGDPPQTGSLCVWKKATNKRVAPAVMLFHLQVRCCNVARQSFSGGTGCPGKGPSRSKRQAYVSRLTTGDEKDQRLRTRLAPETLVLQLLARKYSSNRSTSPLNPVVEHLSSNYTQALKTFDLIMKRKCPSKAELF